MPMNLWVMMTLVLCAVAGADDGIFGPTTQPATQPVAPEPRTWEGMAEILRLVPQDVVPQRRTGWTRATADAAIDAIKPTVGDNVSMQLRALEMGVLADRERERNDDWLRARGKYYIRTQEIAGPWMLVISAYLDDDQIDALQRVKKNDIVSITGQVIGYEFINDRRGWHIVMELKHTQIAERRRRR